MRAELKRGAEAPLPFCEQAVRRIVWRLRVPMRAPGTAATVPSIIAA